MKKVFIAFINIALLLLLSACNVAFLDINSLLSAPQLSTYDQAIQKVMRSELGEAYTFVYPQSGNNRSAVISVDLDKDGENETICFFQTNSDKNIGFMVLRRQQSEVWEIIGITINNASAVNKVEFADLDGDGVNDIVVGWQYTSETDYAIEVLSLSDDSTELVNKYKGLYNQFIISEDNYTKQQSLVLLFKNSAANESPAMAATATLIAQTVDGVGIINTVSLNNMATKYISVQTGLTMNKQTAVYIDEQLDSLLYTTEILVINDKGRLTNDLSLASHQIYRTMPLTCQDMNGDGILDVPRENTVSQSDINLNESMALTNWYSFDGSNFQLVLTAYVNVVERFYLIIPFEWNGLISGKKDQTIDRLFHFSEMKTDLPAFSIRVFTRPEFNEELIGQGWQQISSEAENDRVYAVYIERESINELSFALSFEIIKAQFKLLTKI